MSSESIFDNLKSIGSTWLDSVRLYDREPSDMLTVNDVADLYKERQSFTDFLPWKKYLPEHECFLLEDCYSVAAVYDIYPRNAEGVPLSSLARVRDSMARFLADVFPAHDDNPWVVEFYQSDILSLNTFANTVRNYVKKENGVTKSFLPVIEQHLKDVCRPGGLFDDDVVTGGPWRGAIRCYRMVMYRRYTKKIKSKKGNRDISPVEELKGLRLRVESYLKKARIKATRVDERGFKEWLLRWFNPAPAVTKGDVDALVDMVCKATPNAEAEHDDADFDGDMSECLFTRPPRSDMETGNWYFDEMPHKYVPVIGMSWAPAIGLLSAPKTVGDKSSALFDQLPEGTVMSMKITIQPQHVVLAKMDRIQKKAIGDTPDAIVANEDVQQTKDRMARRQKLFPVELGFFIRGKDEAELRDNQIEVLSALQSSGLIPLDEENDPISLDSYVRNLPMNYDPSLDSRRRRSRLCFTQHIANLVPLYGRGKGTGNPGIIQWNRGGEPMSFDPLNPEDRSKNAHMMIFGPTGSGKSATLVVLIIWIRAVHNARVFICEAGNSFGPLGTYLKLCGDSVSRIRMRSNSGTTLSPFANGRKALEEEERLQALGETTAELEVDTLEEEEQWALNKANLRDSHGEAVDPGIDAEQGDTDNVEEEEADSKDYLGEMEIIARIIVSGGKAELAKSITLGEQNLIRKALLNAARVVRAAGRQCVLPSDVAEQLNKFAVDEKIPSEVRSRFFEFGGAMEKFTQGLAGQIFNREGELMPEADFTHIDLADFVRDQYETELAVSYMALLNNVNDIAERDQYSDRPIVFITDESHIITKNKLLAPGVVKVVKMWRKLGAWKWFATQNMADYADEAKVMLSLCEWWLLLALEPAEVEEVSRFKRLTPDEEALILSARKKNKTYTEGVVLSTKLSELFRVVPPSFGLALGMSEKHEKAQRRKIMKELGLSGEQGELAAIWEVAKKLDIGRGIVRPTEK